MDKIKKILFSILFSIGSMLFAFFLIILAPYFLFTFLFKKGKEIRSMQHDIKKTTDNIDDYLDKHPPIRRYDD